jgi:hypothetical protein
MGMPKMLMISREEQNAVVKFNKTNEEEFDYRLSLSHIDR